MRNTGPKARLCRREGINLFGPEKYTRIVQRRNSAPGQSASARPKKLSEYGKQLREKQKAKRMFGLSEKQFEKLYKQAAASKSSTGNRLLQLLELRIDNVLYRAGFATTRIQARQFVSHRHFELNGKRVDVPSISVKPGDVISVRDRFEANPIFSDLGKRTKYVPKWLKVDEKNKSITIDRLPEAEEFEMVITAPLIVEYYSR